jgi:hypothetical protein
MKIKSIALALIITIMYSCGSKKAAVNNDELIKEINSYVSNVDSNYNLKKEVIEGALTDAKGFNDIGTFKNTVFFDDKTKEVYKIENIEKTKETLTEIYYFKNNKFVFVKFNNQIDGTSKLYIEALKNGKTESLNFYKDKAKRFQKSFEQSQ